MADGHPNNGNNSGCWGIVALLFVLFLVAKFFDGEGTSGVDDPLADSYAREVSDVAADQYETDPTLEPSATEIRRAARHASRAVGALGGEGATIYSTNCEAALAATFDASAYDRCYAFDLFAAKLLSDSGESFSYAQFNEWVIRDRWTRVASRSSLSPALLERHRSAIETAVRAIPVEPEFPPPPPFEISEPAFVGETDVDRGAIEGGADADALEDPEMIVAEQGA